MRIWMAMSRHASARLGAIFWCVITLGASIATAVPAAAAEIRVFCGGAPQQVAKVLATEFEKERGHKVMFTFGVVGAIQQKLAAGEKADVVVLPVPMIDAMDKLGALRPQSRSVFARVGIGVVVRQGAAPPDISTPEAIRKMLLDARSIAYPDPKVTPSGSHLTRMIAQLGIAAAVQPKLTLRNAIDGGVDLVAKGEVEIGMFLVSEILPAKGITLVGLLPPALQSFVVYAAAVPADNASPEPALAFVRLLSDPAKREHWKAAGFEPLSGEN